MITKWEELWKDERGSKSDLVTKHYTYDFIDANVRKEIVFGKDVETTFVKITEKTNEITDIYIGKANILIEQDGKIYFEASDFVKQDINEFQIEIKTPYWKYLD